MKVTVGDLDVSPRQLRQARADAWVNGTNEDAVLMAQWREGRIKLSDKGRQRLAEHNRVRGFRIPGRWDD